MLFGGGMLRDIPDLHAGEINLLNHGLRFEGALFIDMHRNPEKCNKCGNVGNLTKIIQ